MWGYAGWVTSERRVHELRRYCDLRGFPVIFLLAEGVQISGRHVTGPVLGWPEPKVPGAAPRAPSTAKARLTLLQPNPSATTSETALSAGDTVPEWSWPRLFRDCSTGPQRVGIQSRTALLKDMAVALWSCSRGQWWWPTEEGAMGQARHTGARTWSTSRPGLPAVLSPP
jgi:hypothetical protein